MDSFFGTLWRVYAFREKIGVHEEGAEGLRGGQRPSINVNCTIHDVGNCAMYVHICVINNEEFLVNYD